MKKSISITLIIAVICCTALSLSVGAASENYSVVDIEFLNNGEQVDHPCFHHAHIRESACTAN